MKPQVKRTIIFMIALIILLAPAITLAAGAPRLRLSTETLRLAVGQTVTLELIVEDAPLIYGVESHLTFDPTLLEVVEINHGDFLSANPDNETFILQNQADNETGVVDYALALLNPAPPVEGNGLVASITFRAKADGPAAVRIDEALLGTQAGDEIAPLLESADLVIAGGSYQAAELDSMMEESRSQQQTDAAPAPGGDQPAITGDTENSPAQPYRWRETPDAGQGKWLGLSLLGMGLIIVISGVIGLAALAGGWLFIAWTRRRGKQSFSR